MTSEIIYKTLVDRLNEGKKAVVVTTLVKENSGKVAYATKNIFGEDICYRGKPFRYLDATVLEYAVYALKSGNLQFIEGTGRAAYLIEPYLPESRLIVLGGGHIAKPLAEFGSKAGFSVTVADDRPIFANKQRFPDAEKVICEDFQKSIGILNLNKSAFVVIVTRGHRHDITCLRQVLKYDTAYVGMIGSKRRVQSVKEQLLSEGYSRERIDQVNAPIGLEIGAITPEEIAISIIAQVIRYKRLTATSNKHVTHEKSNWPEFDREVQTELGNASDGTKAIVTVISTKGSTPRKTGAKMLVWQDGRTMGSIGGGCSEGAVIRTALDVIRDGGYRIQEVDMTGDIAEDDGMVCGGIMQILIEAY
ncbi:MAG TPA: XdhC/CoxI family protein [Clostridia bacterium]|nr:XdhC/CoxI family protein [Clostridia bacterium]